MAAVMYAQPSPTIPNIVPRPSHQPGLDLSEDLATDFDSNEEYDEMAELSDSPSSRPSLSRPTTPPHVEQVQNRTFRSSSSPPAADHYTLAVKAERVLGLVPGTLAHAKACLENARDEVRRTSAETSPPPQPFELSQSEPFAVSEGDKDKEKEDGSGNGNGKKLKGRFDRAKKVMSVHLPNGGGGGNGHSRIPSVVVGTGGKEEAERRERRRKAVDGVLYWQKEVDRLERAEMKSVKGTIKRK